MSPPRDNSERNQSLIRTRVDDAVLDARRTRKITASRRNRNLSLVERRDEAQFIPISDADVRLVDMASKLAQLTAQLQWIARPASIGSSLLAAEGEKTTLYDRLQMELAEVVNEAATPGWDGTGSPPIVLSTFETAKKFLCLLSARVPEPSIGADPNGRILFEWHKPDKRVVTIAVNAAGQLSYAGTFGSNRQMGTEMLENSVPSTIERVLARLFA